MESVGDGGDARSKRIQNDIMKFKCQCECVVVV